MQSEPRKESQCKKHHHENSHKITNYSGRTNNTGIKV
jgi:hypothetical protein